MGLTIEEAVLAFARRKCLGALTDVWYGLADERAAEPFGVLHLISEGGRREVDGFMPLFQLDVYAADPFAAAEAAEAAASRLENGAGRYGVVYLQGVRCQRGPTLRCGDGTWKVPIDMHLSCLRRRGDE